MKESDEVSQSGGAPVELATLTLEFDAIDTGVITGSGRAVELRARHEIVENILEGAKSTEAGAEIQGVVDLEILSELVGVSEDDFVAGLHRDVNDQFGEDAGLICDLENGDNIESGVSDLVARFSIGENDPLLQQSSHKNQVISDCITLSADPFVESLADVLTRVIDGANSSKTTMEDHQHLAHDAFLLEMPQAPGDNEQHFVLALPKIQMVDEDDVSFLEETLPIMQRMFSMLPTDVEEVNLEATTVPIITSDKKEQQCITTELHLDLVVKRRVPVIGYAILFMGLFALASVGAALNLQRGNVTPTMKTFWRLSSTALLFVPMAIHSCRRDGIPKLSSSQLFSFALCAFFYSFMSTAFAVALLMTTLADAFVLSNLSCLVIIMGKAILGIEILKAEGTGAVIGFIGAAVCAGDASVEDSTPELIGSSNPLLGNFLALLSSFGLAGYLVIAKKLRSSLDLFVFMCGLMTMSSMFLLIYMFASGENFSFSTHPEHGLWGWLSPQLDRLPLEIYLAFICNYVGTTGYIAVMKYFDPVVVSTVMLMEPVIGTLMGAAAGVDPLPDRQVWIGDAIVAIGCFLVIWSGSRKTESIDATSALRTTKNIDDGAISGVAVMKSPILVKSPAHRYKREGSKRVIWRE